MRDIGYSDRRRMPAAVLVALIVLVGAHAGYVRAAEFSLHGPSIELRRIQYCEECNEKLMVTSVPPGAAIRCPRCGLVQRRLPTRYLETKVYQVCPSCSSRLDVSHLKPMRRIRCGTCGLAQPVLPEAVYRGGGTGKVKHVTVPAVDPPASGSNRPPDPSNESESRDEPPVGHWEEDLPELEEFDSLRGAFRQYRRLKENPVPPQRDPPQHRDLPVPEPRAKPQAPERPVARIDSPAAPSVSSPRASLPLPDESMRVAATVNGRPVPVADVARALQAALDQLRLRLGHTAQAPRGREYLRAQKAELKPQILDTLIARELIGQAAERAGFVPPQEDVRRELQALRREEAVDGRPGTILEQARFRVILNEMRRRHAGHAGEITPRQVRRYYDEHPGEFVQPATGALESLVLYRDRQGRADARAANAIAAEIAERLRQGVGFDALVRRFSEGPFAASGGRLCVAGQRRLRLALLATPLQKALQRAESGDVVGPVPLINSIAFCRVETLERDKPLSFEAAQAKIRQRLERQAREQAFNAWVDDLREQADIRLY